jgi:hypothetical protein
VERKRKGEIAKLKPMVQALKISGKDNIDKQP